MIIHKMKLVVLSFVMGTALAWASIPPDVSGKLDKAFGELRRYQWQESQQAVATIESIVRSGDEETQKDVQARSLALLEMEAPFSSKQYVLRVLAVIADADAVDPVSEYLTDPQLSHLARYVLVGVGNENAQANLLAAMDQTRGKLKVGIINSLASLKSSRAVDKLADLVGSSDREIGNAAMMALADIADKKARRAVTALYHQKPNRARTDAYLRLAMTLEKQGDGASADIYEELFGESQEETLRIAGFAGLLRVTETPRELEKLVESGLSHENEKIRKMAGVYLMDTASDEMFRRFAGKINRYTPQAKVALIDAIRSRKYSKARPLLLENLSGDNAGVTIASLTALAELGRVDDIPAIMGMIESADAAIRDAAIICLKSYTAPGSNQAIVRILERAADTQKTELIEVLNFRSAKEALPSVTRYLESSDRKLAGAALDLYADLGDASHLPVLLGVLEKSQNRREESTRMTAIRKICVNYPQEAAAIVYKGYRDAPETWRGNYLTLLSYTDYSEKLEVIRAALKDASKEVKDTAVRLLAEWDNPVVMDDLVAIVKNSDDSTHAAVAFRGYINLLRQKPMSASSKFELLKEAYSLAQNSRQKKQVISAVSEIQAPEAMAFISAALDDPELTAEASLAAISLTQALSADHFDACVEMLEKVIQVDASEAITDDAKASLEKLRKYKGRLLREWSFSSSADGWVAENHCSIAAENNALRVDIEGDDPFISCPMDLPGGELEVQVKVKAAGPTTTWQYFWGSSKKPLAQAPLWIASFDIPADSSGWHTVNTVINVDGNLTRFRIDPGTGVDAVYIDSIRFLMNKPQQSAAGPGFHPDAQTRILLIGTPLDHPFGTHMYMHECGILEKCLDQVPGVDAVVSQGWPTDKALLEDLDAIALYSSPGAEILLTGVHAEDFKSLMKQGVGLAALHWSTGIGDANNKELELEYLGYLGGIFSFAFSGLDMAQAKVIELNREHPISRGWNDFEQLDEIYLDVKLLDQATELIEVRFKDRVQTVAWAYERPDSNGGRSYGNTLGHFHENFWIPEFRRTYVNGILWTAKVEIPQEGAVSFIVPEDMKLQMP